MRKIIYSCISDQYDLPKDHVIPKGWDYAMIESSGGPKASRHNKILCPFFESYDLSVWVDGHIQITGDIDKFVAERHKKVFSLMKHPERNCIYREAEECKRQRKDNPAVIDAQMKKYAKEVYPHNNGLVATGILVRNHTAEVINFCMQWWDQVRTESCRDQLSFNYIAWKTKLDYATFPYVNKLSEFRKHRHK